MNDFKKIRLIGKNLDDIRPRLLERGFQIVESGFDLVVAHGGDGTLLIAEREFPGIPKLPVRDARTAMLCSAHNYDTILDKFAAGLTPVTEMPKLEAEYDGRRITALNDIFAHNRDRISALRYRVKIDGELYADEIVGDAVGVATVHGSTAYFSSITSCIFRVGIGLAFSNSTEAVNHLVLNDSAQIEVTIVRGPALLVADNSPDFINVPEGGSVVLRKAATRARVYGLADFMCPECRLLRHPHRHPFKNYLPL